MASSEIRAAEHRNTLKPCNQRRNRFSCVIWLVLCVCIVGQLILQALYCVRNAVRRPLYVVLLVVFMYADPLVCCSSHNPVL
jgi:hypothetical protein